MTDRVMPLQEPDDFVAAIPAMVGMIPDDQTAVAVVLDTEGIVRTVLMIPMLPSATLDAIEHLGSYDSETHGLVLAMIVDDLTVGRDFLMSFGVKFPIPVVSIFLISALVPGAPYIEGLIGHMGTVPDFRNSPLTAEAVMEGRMVDRTMADIAKIYEPTEPMVTPTVVVEEEITGHLANLAGAAARHLPYSSAMVGGLLTFSPKVRDWVLKVAYVEASAAHEIFAEAGRVLRGPARVEALTAAGLAAYVDGEGIMARHALYAAKITASECQPVYDPSLAMTLDDALTNNVPPSLIAHTVFADLIEEETS